MQSIGIHTTREDFSRTWRNSIVGACQSGDGVEQDDHIFAHFHASFCFFDHHLCGTDMIMRRKIKG